MPFSLATFRPSWPRQAGVIQPEVLLGRCVSHLRLAGYGFEALAAGGSFRWAPPPVGRSTVITPLARARR